MCRTKTRPFFQIRTKYFCMESKNKFKDIRFYKEVENISKDCLIKKIKG